MQSRHTFRAAVVLVSAAVCSHAQTSSATNSTGKALPPVSADYQVTKTPSKGKAHVVSGHFYRSRDGKTCEESLFGSVITDRSSGTVTILQPWNKEAVVVKGLKGIAPPGTASQAGGMSEFGTTTIEGHPVVQRRSLPVSGSGKGMEVWTATDLSMTVYVSTARPDHTTVKTFSNIKVGDPASSVFAVPAGYTITDKTGPLAAPGTPPVPCKSKACAGNAK